MGAVACGNRDEEGPTKASRCQSCRLVGQRGRKQDFLKLGRRMSAGRGAPAIRPTRRALPACSASKTDPRSPAVPVNGGPLAACSRRSRPSCRTGPTILSASSMICTLAFSSFKGSRSTETREEPKLREWSTLEPAEDVFQATGSCDQDVRVAQPLSAISRGGAVSHPRRAASRIRTCRKREDLPARLLVGMAETTYNASG